jgi:signal transduction histidine kinase/ligand-binding sensor domain-containing protein/DNA-binding NarL/FixJ family response regulator
MKTQSRISNIFLISILLFGISIKVISQKIESNLINKYSTEQGLSSNIIYSILQDKYGLIWIATEEGLNKFDGKSFTHFSINNGRYSLSHNRTQTLLQARDGNIWAGTSDGLNIYDYKSDSIIKVRTNTSPMKLVYNDITCLVASIDKSRIWIGTYGNGVNYFDWKTNKFYALTLPKIPSVPAPLNVMSILDDDNNRLWIGTQHDGLYRYNLEEEKLEFFELPENGRFVRSIYQDSFRRIWIGTSKGCYLYNETTNKLDLITYPESLNINSIGGIKEDRNGLIWLGTENFLMGFSVRSFSLTEKFAYQVIKQGESATSLRCASINSLFTDKDNNLWIGTAWGGVNMLHGTSTKFKLYKHDPERLGSIPNSPINAIAYDGEGSIFVATMGTDKVGLYKMNLQSGESKPLEVSKKLSGNVYQSLLYDLDGNLWIGTYNNGLIKSNKQGTGLKQYLFNNKNNNSLPGNDVRTIFQAKDKSIWIGTSSGLAKFDLKTQTFSRIQLIKNSIVAIRSIEQDNKGVLWIGTYGKGVLTYNTVNHNINLDPTNQNTHVVSDIFLNGDSVWIATQGEGLFFYNQKNKSNANFNSSKGLLSNYLASLERDNTGKIWIGTSKGLSRIDPKTNEIESFRPSDGIQNREFSERAALALPNGLFAFSGFGGINIFNPQNVTKNDKCPSVFFTKLLIFDELITPSENKDEYSPLKENITLTHKIELKYNQYVFTIEFMGINYNADQKTQYAYFLEGSDKKWNYLGNQNSVTFRNLQPGKYVFKVKASSPDAVWSDSNIASIIIIVRPPWWASWWAYLIYFILFIALLYLAWLFVNIRIETANGLKIERARREKDEELHQEKLQFFTNISHEFRTPLTLIIGPLEKLQFEEIDPDKKSNIKLMLRNANRLLTMVNQLLDFRKTERGQMKLKVQRLDIKKSISEIILSFDELKKQRNINLKLTCADKELWAWFDLEFLNKSLTNLLSNAFKFTPDGGEISISLLSTKDTLENNQLEITVSDNGKGIQTKDINNIFDRFFQGKEKSNMQQGSGIGLHLVKNLIELHHGTIEVESTPGIQTSFKITLPIEKSAYLKDEFMEDTESGINRKKEQSNEENDKIIHENNLSDNSKSNHKKRILVVEDNADIRSYMRSILGSNYIIEEAENGAIGLEAAVLQDFDLIISDIMMPEMDGIEMCKQLKKSIETNHIPIILLTAKSDIENRIEGLSIGADSYITKPFHPQHLTIRVEKLIELREMLQERYSRKISLGEMHNQNIKSESPEELFLQKAISIILDKMIESDFNGDVLANELCISRMGLHRKIKALTGQSTGEFIRNIRLKKACELLSNHGKNISEVCYDVGFNSPSYFTTCFTEVYKMTPTDFVKSIKLQIE